MSEPRWKDALSAHDPALWHPSLLSDAGERPPASCLPCIRAQVCIEIVGYLLEELRDNKNYEEFQKDVANANIFIGSLIFIEELAEKVRMRLHVHFAASALLQIVQCSVGWQIVETVGPARERMDACLVFPSMPAVMCAVHRVSQLSPAAVHTGRVPTEVCCMQAGS